MPTTRLTGNGPVVLGSGEAPSDERAECSTTPAPSVGLKGGYLAARAVSAGSVEPWRVQKERRIAGMQLCWKRADLHRCDGAWAVWAIGALQRWQESTSLNSFITMTAPALIDVT